MRISIVPGITIALVLSTGLATYGQDAQSKRAEALKYGRQANPFVFQHDYASALPLLRQACAIDDSFAAAHANLGLSLVKLNQFDEGKRELERAIQLDPNLAPPYINIAPVYLSVGDLPAAARAYETFLSLCGDSPERANAEKSLAGVKEQIANSAANGANDYFDIAVKRGAYIWSRQKMPLRVFVGPGAGVEGYKPEYGQILRGAFSDWSQATGGRITFIETPDPNGADISCEWSHDPGRIPNQAEGGQEVSSFNTRLGLTHANIVFLTTDPPGMKLTDTLVSWVSHHEIGHALGINGHSPNVQDVMYFTGTAATTHTSISQRDINTLARLYTNF